MSGSKAAKPHYELRRCTVLVGDLQAGRLMRWIASYHRHAKPKHGLDGGRWNANPRAVILKNTGLTWKQYRRASAILIGLGAAEIEVHWYAGKRMVYSRPTESFVAQFASGSTHWQSTAISAKGHDRGHDEGHDHSLLVPLVPNGDSDVVEESPLVPGETPPQETNKPTPIGSAENPRTGVVVQIDHVRLHKRRHPSLTRADPEFLRLATAWCRSAQDCLAGGRVLGPADLAELQAIRARAGDLACCLEEYGHEGDSPDARTYHLAETVTYQACQLLGEPLPEYLYLREQNT